ncbi:Nesprin-1 [Portunus trituberculatus]|uniref:Nesprin-1 n=1 Tax=Portunus trituberculatus TaxID=210409 RepID=A0A5B7E881_PORTR|nr:Nesprin-1 [Portunus trituberculatus]
MLVIVMVMVVRGVAGPEEEDAGSEMLHPLDQYDVRASHDAAASTPLHRLPSAAAEDRFRSVQELSELQSTLPQDTGKPRNVLRWRKKSDGVRDVSGGKKIVNFVESVYSLGEGREGSGIVDKVVSVGSDRRLHVVPVGVPAHDLTHFISPLNDLIINNIQVFLDILVLVGEAAWSGERVSELRQLAHQIRLHLAEDSAQDTPLVAEVERLGFRITNLTEAITQLSSSLTQQVNAEQHQKKESALQELEAGINGAHTLLALPEPEVNEAAERATQLKDQLVALGGTGGPVIDSGPSQLVEAWQIAVRDTHSRYQQFLTWAKDMEDKIDGGSEQYIDTLIRKLEHDYQEDINAKSIEMHWLLSEDAELQNLEPTLSPVDMSLIGAVGGRSMVVEMRVALDECKKIILQLEEALKCPTPQGAEVDKMYYSFSKQLAGCRSSVDLLSSLKQHTGDDTEARELHPEIDAVIEEFSHLEAKAQAKQQRLKENSFTSRVRDFLVFLAMLGDIAGLVAGRFAGMLTEFLMDLDGHKSVIMSLNIIGKHLADHTRDERRATRVRDRLAATNRRWEAVCAAASVWQAKLQTTLMGNSEFHSTIADLLAWTETTEESLLKIAAEKDMEETALRDRVARVLDVRAEVERCEPRVASLHEAAQHLLPTQQDDKSAAVLVSTHTDPLKPASSVYAYTCLYGLILGVGRRQFPMRANLSLCTYPYGMYQSKL